MRRFYTILAAVGGLTFSLSGGNALAGSCGYNGPMPACVPHYAPPPVRYAPPPPPPVYMAPPPVYQPAPRPIYRPMPMPRPTPPCHAANRGHGCAAPTVISHPGAPTTVDPVVITTSQPLDHLRSVRFHGSPHVNITRLYGQGQTVGITDAPRAFTGGCHPSSTHYGSPNAHQYCGQNTSATQAAPQPVRLAAPTPKPVHVQAPAPVQIAPPAPQPLSIAPPPPISDYWEKTSGPTIVDGMPATQVFCRRPVPVPTPVHRPVIGVPVPVPTPVYPSCYNPSSRYAAEPVLAGGPKYSRGSRYGSAY